MPLKTLFILKTALYLMINTFYIEDKIIDLISQVFYIEKQPYTL